MDEETTDLIDLATRCSRLGKEGFPDKVITLTEDVTNSTRTLPTNVGLDRIYCTRGAAFRQLGNNADALKCALRSLEINNEFQYAYNLAGAAAIGLGNHEKAEEYFNKARKRGINHKHIEMLKRLAQERRTTHQTKQKNKAIQGTRFIYPYEDYGYESIDLYGRPYSEYEDRFYQDDMYQEVDSFSEMWDQANEDGWFYGDD